MSLIQVRVFGGMRPQRSADMLLNGEGQNASDVRLTAGELRPLQGKADYLTLSGAPQVKSIYRFGQTINSNTQYWFQSTGDVDYAKGPIASDTTERTFFTDGAFPKKTDSSLATSAPPYPTASYAMGVPAPAAAATVNVTGSATNPSDPGETVVYVYTYVSVWGEEGPPSPASSPATWRAGQTLNLSTLSVAPGAGAHGENYNIVSKRIYRSATGSQATQYQLISSTPTAIATTTATDTALTANLLDVLVTLGWIEPPYNMTGLCAGPNGMMAGFVNNTLCFCEPSTPYAWPVRYQQNTDAPIVGIAWFDQTVFVGTTQGIYLYTGADPASMTGQKLNVAQAPVSKRSIVAMLGGVLFASPDGLFRIDSSGITNLTDGLMTKVEWQLYVPSSISAYESDNRYLAFYDTGSLKAGMMFTFGSQPTFTVTSLYAYAGFRDKKQSALFFVPNTSNTLSAFDDPTGAALTYTWTSAVYHLADDEAMACAIVDAAAYPVTFKLYADGNLMLTQTVANRFAFRLPGGYRSKRYYFTLTGTSIVREVKIAASMYELEER